MSSTNIPVEQSWHARLANIWHRWRTKATSQEMVLFVIILLLLIICWGDQSALSCPSQSQQSVS